MSIIYTACNYLSHYQTYELGVMGRGVGASYDVTVEALGGVQAEGWGVQPVGLWLRRALGRGEKVSMAFVSHRHRSL